LIDKVKSKECAVVTGGMERRPRAVGQNRRTEVSTRRQRRREERTVAGKRPRL